MGDESELVLFLKMASWDEEKNEKRDDRRSIKHAMGILTRDRIKKTT